MCTNNCVLSLVGSVSFVARLKARGKTLLLVLLYKGGMQRPFGTGIPVKHVSVCVNTNIILGGMRTQTISILTHCTPGPQKAVQPVRSEL